MTRPQIHLGFQDRIVTGSEFHLGFQDGIVTGPQVVWNSDRTTGSLGPSRMEQST